MTSIRAETFQSCTGLTSITIPNSVTTIGDVIFYGCSSLKDVYCYAGNVPNTESSAFDNSNVSRAILHVPASSVTSYKAASPWKNFKDITSIKKTITYMVDGEVYKSYEIDYNTSITPEPAPVKEGHTFSGWSYIPWIMPANDVVVTGSFSVNSYTLTYEIDHIDYMEYKSCKIAFGTTITPEKEPSKEGYTFSGWIGLPTTMPAHDVTVKGSFIANKYFLIYKVDGKVYKTVTIAYGTDITPEIEPSKEGYTFSGWSEIPETMPAHDVTVTGSFSVNSYTLTYEIDHIDYMEYKSCRIAYGTTITPEKEPSKEGYTFSGWSGLPTTMPAHDVTVKGYFIANKYFLTYKVDGKVYKTVTIVYGTEITPETEPSKEGYTFSGWSDIPTTMPAHDVTVTGSFSINSYTLTYMVDGNEYKSLTVVYGTALTPEKKPTKEGYTFSGWSGLPATMPAHDVTVTGTFTVNSYTLRYMVDGKAYKTTKIAYGTFITPEANPSKEGYTFSGWSNIPTTMPAHDVTVTGSFSINSYTLTYMVDGNEYKSLTVVYGTALTPEKMPTKEGYTFSGWSNIPSTMPAHDVVVTGSFTINSYTLTYKIDGKVYKTYKIDYNTVLIPESVPVKKGMTFSGWGEIPETMPAHNVTLSGTYSWSQKTLNSAIYQVIDTLNNYAAVIGNKKASGDVKILPSVEVGGYDYSVTTIGSSAFVNCGELTSIVIPESISNIAINAFNGCSNLYRVTLESNSVVSKSYSSNSSLKNIFGVQVKEYIIGDEVTSIGSYVFSGCSDISNVTIPGFVTSIGQRAFLNCNGLTSVTLCSSNLSVSSNAFEGCHNLKQLIFANGCTKAVSTGLTSVSEVVLPKTLQTIDANAFYNFRNLKTITIPQSVTNIGQQAFYGCAALASVTMENNNLTEIYQSSFPSQAKLYVKRGTKTLLTLWKNGYTRPYEIGTDKQLPPSSLSVVSTTQMTATIKVNDFYDGYAYTFNDEKIGKDAKTLSVPYPGYKFNQPLKISLDDVLYTTNPYSFQTKGLNMKAERTGGTASSMTVKASYEHGDAPVTAQTLSLDGVTVEDDEIYLNGLKPSASYTVTYVVWINNEYAIRENFKFSTNALQFTASQPKVISEGNVIIASKSNLDDGETNVGFEWRRTGWTSEFPSNRAGAYLYEGMIEGYIRNLNTNYLWKYRPYYETQDGSRYYGDWTGIDPTNTSYFEPTVHTYDKIEVNGNRARVKGYAMRGSDNIVSQGFRYWRSTESSTRAQQVEADGQVMSIELKGLDYHTTYRVVAFVTTSEGKTYYGKEQLFTTGDQTGIEETFADEPQKITEEGIYDLSGKKLERMQKGINIIRKADGTIKKVLVK